MTVRDNLWGAINATQRSTSEQQAVDSMTKLCTEMSK
jgi:hypothetical protein